MSSVLLDFGTTTFQELVDDARASIPPLAPGWTDYNVSDPGIMLIELLAWNTEAQLYALGHLSQKERAAYSALLGVRARGPRPARGLIWPQLPPGTPPPWGGGHALAAQTRVHAQRGNLPDLFLTRALWLHGASLASVVVVKRDGTRLDYTPINQRRYGSFPVFGPNPERGDRLRLGLSAYPVPYATPAGAPVAVGFRIRNPATGLTARNGATARFRATLRAGAQERTVPIREDSTLGLARSGVLLIECPPELLTSGHASVLTLELVAGELYPAPLAERIGLNVLPAVQQEQCQDSFTQLAPWPDAALTLTQAGICFGDGEPPVTLSVSSATSPAVSWTQVDDFARASPADTVFSFDPSAGRVQFGNGVNGAIPPSGSHIVASYRTSQGQSANVAGGLTWLVEGVAGVYGSNLDAVTGGADADQLADIQGRARDALSQRPIVTDQDLIAAATALKGLRVVRAEMAPAGSSPPATRTLVVLRDRDSASSALPESSAWLSAVQQALAARLTLGQRLRVIAPRYVPIQLKAALTVTADADPTVLIAEIVEALQARFAPFANDASETPWPMGAAVAVPSIRGWLRALPGVLAVTSVQVTSGTATLTGQALALPPTGLPELTLAASDITLTRTALGSRR